VTTAASSEPKQTQPHEAATEHTEGGGGGTESKPAAQFTNAGAIPPVAAGGDVPAAPPSASDRAFGHVTVPGLNVRSAPAKADNNIVGVLHHGDKVETVGRDGAWLKIAHPGGEAFVHGAFVHVEGAGPAAPHDGDAQHETQVPAAKHAAATGAPAHDAAAPTHAATAPTAPQQHETQAPANPTHDATATHAAATHNARTTPPAFARPPTAHDAPATLTTIAHTAHDAPASPTPVVQAPTASHDAAAPTTPVVHASTAPANHDASSTHDAHAHTSTVAHDTAPAAATASAAPAPSAATAHATATPADAHTFTTLKGTQVKESTDEEASTLHLIRADARRLSPEWLLAAQQRLEIGDTTGAMNTETLRAIRTFAKKSLTATQILDEKFLATIKEGPFFVEGTVDGFQHQPADPHANTPADHAAQAAGYASFAAYKRDVVPFKFLGQKMKGQGSGEVHKYLLARLQAAEAFLHQKYGKDNSQVLQSIQWSGEGNGGYDDEIGTHESHQHTMGLAIDIDPKQNPWLFSRSITGLDDTQMQWWYDTWEMMFYVACTVYGGDPITHDKMKQWSEKSSTEELYSKIDQNRESFDKYLTLSKQSPKVIKETLLQHQISEAYINQHIADIQKSSTYFHNGFGRTKETKSFTGIHEDLLVALRDVAGLAWGGTEMSSNENGDFMHFDCRETDFGRTIYSKTRTTIK
jgi:hypothetical protein